MTDFGAINYEWWYNLNDCFGCWLDYYSSRTFCFPLLNKEDAKTWKWGSTAGELMKKYITDEPILMFMRATLSAKPFFVCFILAPQANQVLPGCTIWVSTICGFHVTVKSLLTIIQGWRGTQKKMIFFSPFFWREAGKKSFKEKGTRERLGHVPALDKTNFRFF